MGRTTAHVFGNPYITGIRRDGYTPRTDLPHFPTEWATVGGYQDPQVPGGKILPGILGMGPQSATARTAFATGGPPPPIVGARRDNPPVAANETWCRVVLLACAHEGQHFLGRRPRFEEISCLDGGIDTCRRRGWLPQLQLVRASFRRPGDAGPMRPRLHIVWQHGADAIRAAGLCPRTGQLKGRPCLAVVTTRPARHGEGGKRPFSTQPRVMPDGYKTPFRTAGSNHRTP
jgi:hypothetical protein